MNKQIIYIGCYTPNGEAGIAVIDFDCENGQLKQLNTLAELDDASFLALSKDKKRLFAVSEDVEQGFLGLYNIEDPANPVFINKQSSLGGAPCHISVSVENVFVSNYVSGNVSAFALTADKLLPAYNLVQHHGQGGHLDRQKNAHAHASQFSVDEKFLVVADLGIDALKVYRIEATQLVAVSTTHLPSGAGPRHLTFNSTGDKLYLGNELNSEVCVFNFNAITGELTLLQSMSSLPNDYNAQQVCIESYIAEVALSQDGQYLYVSNRGHDSIAIFAVHQSSGILTALEFTKTGGLFPRHFALSPDQKWLLVAHQNSDYLVVFKRDNESGLLTKTDNKLSIKHAVCVCFL